MNIVIVRMSHSCVRMDVIYLSIAYEYNPELLTNSKCWVDYKHSILCSTIVIISLSLYVSLLLSYVKHSIVYITLKKLLDNFLLSFYNIVIIMYYCFFMNKIKAVC